MDEKLTMESNINTRPDDLDKSLIESQDSQDPDNVAEIVEVN